MEAKDKIDIALKVATLLVTGFLALIGWNFQRNQEAFNKAEQISQETSRTIQLLADVEKLNNAPDDASRSQAYGMVGALQDKTFRQEMSPTVAGDKWFLAWTQRLQDAAAAPSPSAVAPIVQTTSRKGWVYLGQFNGKSWDTRYFDGIDPTVAPTNLGGKVISPQITTGAVYVRAGAATEHALMPVTGSVRPGTTVKILAVKQVPNNPHWWAQVALP